MGACLENSSTHLLFAVKYVIIFVYRSIHEKTTPKENKMSNIDLKALVSQMTLQEKVDQLFQLTGNFFFISSGGYNRTDDVFWS